MAKISTSRRKGTLLVKVLPSLDHPEQAAVCLSTNVPIRIHNVNGGYLTTIVARNGRVEQFVDRIFMDGLPGELAVQPFDTNPQFDRAREELGHV